MQTNFCHEKSILHHRVVNNEFCQILKPRDNIPRMRLISNTRRPEQQCFKEKACFSNSFVPFALKLQIFITEK